MINRRTTVAAVALAVILSSSSVQALEINWKKVGRFLAGVAVSVVIHEGGHAIAAEVEDIHLHFRGTEWTADQYSTTLKLSGLIANAVSSEAVLLVPPERRGAFCNGILMGNVFEEMTYPTIRYDWDSGDFGLRESEARKRSYAALFVAHGASTLYRVHRAKQLDLKVWIGRTGDAPGVGVAWSW